jgi:hypothetical protein
MQEKLIVRIIAVITATTGLFVIAKDWRAYLTLHQVFSRSFEMLGPLVTALGLLVMAVPVAKLIAAFGLFLSKRWGWFLAIAVLTVDFFVGFQIAIRMCIFSARHPATAVPPPDSYTVAKVFSLGPSYIISIIVIISVVALLQKSIRNHFDKQERLAYK